MSWDTVWTEVDVAVCMQDLFNGNRTATVLDKKFNRAPGSCKKVEWRVDNDAIVYRSKYHSPDPSKLKHSQYKVYNLAVIPVPDRSNIGFKKAIIDYVAYHVVLPNGPEDVEPEIMDMELMAAYTGHTIEGRFGIKQLVKRNMERWLTRFHKIAKKEKVFFDADVARVRIERWLKKYE